MPMRLSWSEIFYGLSTPKVIGTNFIQKIRGDR